MPFYSSTVFICVIYRGLGLAGVVAVVAKAVFDSQQSWEELFALLLQLAAEPNEKLRAVNYKLLSELVEKVPNLLKGHSATIAQMFVQGCQDGNHDVSIAAMSAVGSYINQLGKRSHITCAIQTL
jgi:hypothetical protein